MRRIAAVVVTTVLFVGCAAEDDAAGEGDPVNSEESTTSEAPTTSEQPTTTAAPTTTEAPTTTTAPTTTSPPTTAPPPPPPAPALMPAVVCMNLQEAQDLIQENGVFFSRSYDATGEGRSQLIDSNWIVVTQTPAPGTPIGEAEAMLGAVKYGEPAPC